MSIFNPMGTKPKTTQADIDIFLKQESIMKMMNQAAAGAAAQAASPVYQNQMGPGWQGPFGQPGSLQSAVYKTQAQQYADAQGGISVSAMPSPSGILNGTNGATLTFTDGSVYNIPHERAEDGPQVEDGVTIRNGNPGNSSIVVRSPNRLRTHASIVVEGREVGLDRNAISELVHALLEAGAMRRGDESDSDS